MTIADKLYPSLDDEISRHADNSEEKSADNNNPTKKKTRSSVGYKDIEKCNKFVSKTADVRKYVAKQDDEREVCRAQGDLYLFNGQRQVFEIRIKNVDAVVARIGEDEDFSYIMFGENENGERVIVQEITTDMQLRCFENHHSIIWILFDADFGFTTWSIVFRDQEEENEFKNVLNKCLYEASALLPFEKIKDEDSEWILNANRIKTDQEDTDYGDDDFVDFVHDEDTDTESETESESDEDTRHDRHSSKADNNGDKNTLLAHSHKNNRVFVVRGNKIGVFKQGEDDAVYDNTIENISTLQGHSFTPSHMMLYDMDKSALLLHPKQNDERYKGVIYRMDLERGKIVEEWEPYKDKILNVSSLLPVNKYAQHKPESCFVAMNPNIVFGIDPRQSGKGKMIGDPLKLMSSSAPGFSCSATTDTGCLVVGSKKGEIRLYSGVPGMPKSSDNRKDNPKTAKTLLPGFGDAIKGIDVTHDGQWVLTTSKTYLLAIPTAMPDASTTGFEVRMGKNKPQPRMLQLLPEDVRKIKDVNFTPARFNTGADGEVWIVTSSGPYVITWNFRQVQRNNLSDYTIKKMYDEVVTDQFASIPDTLPGADAPIVVAMPDDVSIQTRIHTKANPFKSHNYKYTSK